MDPRKKPVQALEADLGLFGKRILGLRYLAQDSGGLGFLTHGVLFPWGEVQPEQGLGEDVL